MDRFSSLLPFPAVDGQVLRVQYAYQQTAADEISLRPGQHVLAIEHSEDGWVMASDKRC